MTCTGQHFPPENACVECAIERCRACYRFGPDGELAGPVRIKRSCWPKEEFWPRNHEEMWRIIAIYAKDVRDRAHALWRSELRRRWRALPPVVREANQDVAEAFADDQPAHRPPGGGVNRPCPYCGGAVIAVKRRAWCVGLYADGGCGMWWRWDGKRWQERRP